MLPCCSSHRKQHWDVYKSFILRLTSFLWTGLAWLEANYPKGKHLSCSPCAACWIPTWPPPFFRDSFSLWGPGVGSQARIPFAVLGSSKMLRSSLPERGKWCLECGLGLHPAKRQTSALTLSVALREEEEEEEKVREELVKLLRAARERRGEGGWSLHDLLFNYALLSHQGWRHTPKHCFVHLSPPADVGSVSS